MKNHLRGELLDRYLKRSALFWKFSRDAKFARWQKESRNAAWKSLVWDCGELGITVKGKEAAERLGFAPTEIFAHPEVIKDNPELFEYYRLLSCLSNKGYGQIKMAFGISKRNLKTNQEVLLKSCILLNNFLSNALARTVSMNREHLLRIMFAEAGSEWQGTWVNQIGILASQELEAIIIEFAKKKNLIDEIKTEKSAGDENIIFLKSGNNIRFASEPDVECRNKKGDLICVLEIKGSADKAGAQTRLGETKKSFTKAKHENPHCITIFLPSVLTASVKEQLKKEREIDKVFDLLEITNDNIRRREFLNELFKYVLRENIS